jgi:RimJ/RimL family protein N-acetyltransferase
MVFDKHTGEAIGCSRYYDYNHKSVLIGYTFFARSHWGGKYNPALKQLMIQYAFRFVDSVFFHIGAHNTRSQRAIEKLGAFKIDELEVTYYGESSKLNFVYEIKKEDWYKK